MRRLLGIILVVVVVAVGLSFSVLNSETVQVKYYLGQTQAPLALVVAIALSGGALLGVLASLAVVLNQKRQIVKLHRTVSLHEQEIRNLREIPLKDRD